MYAWLKLLHLLCVIGFLGNVTTGLFWHRHAMPTRDPRILAHTMRGIIRSDRLFTVPGVVGVTTFGIVGAIVGHLPLLHTPWIFWSIVLFTISGVIFSTRLIPLQRQLAVLAEAGASTGSFDFLGYERLTLRWERWGAVATLAPLGALVLMVLKPAL